MKCPNDQTDLNMTDRQGIEIDYCPQCRGVWLDRGELDKIIERSSSHPNVPPVAHTNPQPTHQAPQPYGQSSDHYPQNHQGHYYKKHKKENFLGDLFDF